MGDEYIRKFYNEVCQTLDGDYKIILEPNRSLSEYWIEYDTVKWELEEPLKNLVTKLQNDNTLTFEEKILSVYKYICLNYIYDDNVLYFFKKDCSDPNNIKYIAVDWYGRIVGNTWIENRKKHNRRICYEFSRMYAKAINELLDGNDKMEACMIGDRDNTHYVVGLTGEKYSAILDLDDFNSIKDLTRLKLGLTITGIKILRDNSCKLQDAIDKFNTNRPVELAEIENAKEEYKEGNINIIQYFKSVLEALKKFNIDSQGIFEYMRLIAQQEEIEIEKLWKEVNAIPEKRNERCFTFEYDGNTYLMDSVEKNIRIVDKKELYEKFILNPAEKEYSYFGG